MHCHFLAFYGILWQKAICSLKMLMEFYEDMIEMTD
jgi:hypothetical protein